MDSNLDSDQFRLIEDYKEKKEKISKIIKVDIENYKKQIVDIEKIYSFHLNEYLAILRQIKDLKKKIEDFIEKKYGLDITIKIFNDQLNYLNQQKNINDINIYKDDLSDLVGKKKKSSFASSLFNFFGFGKKANSIKKEKNKKRNTLNDEKKNNNNDPKHNNCYNNKQIIHNHNFKETINTNTFKNMRMSQALKKSNTYFRNNGNLKNNIHIEFNGNLNKKKSSFFFSPIKRNSINKTKEEIIHQEIFKFHEELYELEMKIGIFNHELLESVINHLNFSLRYWM